LKTTELQTNRRYDSGRVRNFRWIPALAVGLIAGTGLLVVCMSLIIQIEVRDEESALVALGDLQTKATLVHLQLEPNIADVGATGREDAAALVSAAIALGNTVAARAVAEPLRLIETDALRLKQATLNLQATLDHFGDAFSRVQQDPSTRPSFDGSFTDLLTDCTILRRELQDHSRKHQATQRQATNFLLVLCLVLLAIGGLVHRRRVSRRLETESALRRSEARFRELANLLPAGVFETDTDGLITYANKEMVGRFGLTGDDIHHGHDLFAPEDRKAAMTVAEKLVRDRTSVSCELNMVQPNGAVFAAQIHAVPIIADDLVIGTRGIIGNISEQRTTEAALRAEKEKYQVLMRIAPVGIFRMDLTGRCTYINERGAHLLGISISDALNSDWAQALHPDDRDRVMRQWQETIAGETRFTVEARHLMPDESVVWFLAQAEPERDDAGNVISYIGSLIDITDRRQAALAAQKGEERFRRLSDAATEGIILHTDGRFVDVNRTAADMLGSTPEELAGQSIYPYIAPESRPMVQKLVTDGYDRAYEIAVRRCDGSTFPAEVLGRNTTIDGKLARVTTIRDITRWKEAQEEIAKFKTISDIAHYGSAITDLTGVFIYVNDHYAAMHGYKAKDLVGRHARICQDNSSIEDFKQELEQLFDKRHEGTRESWHKRRSGIRFPTLQTTTVVSNSNGQPRYIAATVIDISDLKDAERTLQQLAALPENNPDLVLTFARDGSLRYLNPAARQLLDAHGLKSDDIRQWLPQQLDDLIRSCLKTGEGLADLEGHYRDSIWTWKIHPIPGQDIVHCYGTDMTVRLSQQRDLRKLSAAVAQSANLICVTDVSGRIEYVNPRFSEVTGYSSAEALGQLPSLLKSGQHDDAFYRDMWAAISSGVTWTGLVHNRRKNGELYWERKTISSIFDDQSEITHYLSVGEDITIELQTQQKLVESDKMSAIGMLAAGVAHEFKNYLGGIIGNASFALEELDGDGGLELAGDTLKQIIEMGDRANDVAMSLLSYSKARPDDFTLEDLSGIVTRSISLIEKEMKNLSIEVVTHYEKAPKAEVSASKIQQLLLNMLINAQHAIETDGVITVCLFAGPDWLTIKVADSGCGIPETNLNRIFDPFYSSKGVWGKDELVGTGMGLSICRNIAREHKGDLTVESVVGIGTSFSLTLPVKQHAAESKQFRPEDGQECRVLVFSLQKDIITACFNDATDLGARLFWADSVAHLGDDLNRIADFAICDAKYTGKVELLRMVELCRKHSIPYVMVNCGVMEYQLAELYDGARANFKELPNFERLLSCRLMPKNETGDLA